LDARGIEPPVAGCKFRHRHQTAPNSGKSQRVNPFGFLLFNADFGCNQGLLYYISRMANKLPIEKKVLVISMLCEGASIRGVERITGVNQNTIMSLGLRVGKACARILDEKMRGLNCRNIEVDEIWGFIGKKEKRATRKESMIIGVGDVWTFIALDADTKIIPSFVVGRRDSYHAKAFMEDLAGRLSRRVQLSTDAPYFLSRSRGARLWFRS